MRDREHGRREDEEEEHGPNKPGCAEGAGQVAANCAAVCCCCPLALLDVLLLVAVKLPAGVMRRVRRCNSRRRARARARRRLAAAAAAAGTAASSPSGSVKAMIANAAPPPQSEGAEGAESAESRLEREIMASRFYGAGFWRSVSSGSSSCASSMRHQ